jgi:hypothetical protein
MKEKLAIFDGYNVGREPKISSQDLVNMYVIRDEKSKTGSALVPMIGRRRVITLSEGGAIRNMYTYREYMYAVSGNKIHRIDSILTPALLGTISNSVGFVGISSNENELIFVNGLNGYVWNRITTTFSTISAAGFPSNPASVATLDGYFIVNSSGSNQFNISGSNNGLDWNALNFALMQSQADEIISLAVLNRKLFLFGKKITEVWYNVGAADFPFRRDNNLLIEYGCKSAGSIAVGYQLMFWLAASKEGGVSIVVTDGTMPKTVSTPAIEYVLQQMTDATNTNSLLYKADGHIFYELSFTNENKTFIYDLTTGIWLRGMELNKTRSIDNCHCFFNEKHYVGSSMDKKIYEMSSQLYSNDGEDIYYKIISGHFCDPSLKKTRILRINLDIVAGDELNSNELPLVFLSCSKDGGRSYSDKKTAGLGKIGERLYRCIFRRLGSSRDWVFKFEFFGKTKFMVLNAIVDYEIYGR